LNNLEKQHHTSSRLAGVPEQLLRKIILTRTTRRIRGRLRSTLTVQFD
jgi:hypothetical protein